MLGVSAEWKEWEQVGLICGHTVLQTDDKIGEMKPRMATVTIEKSDLDKLAEFTKNTHWLLEHVDNLRAEYPDRYIAVFDSGKQVLDAQTMEELTRKILEHARDPGTCAIEFVTREPYLLIV